MSSKPKPKPPPPPLHPSIVQIPKVVLESYLKEFDILHKQCMFCGTVGKYIWNTVIYEFRPFFQGGLALGAGIPTVPVILIICVKCGDIRHISTIVTKMTPQVTTKPSPSPPPKKDPLDGR